MNNEPGGRVGERSMDANKIKITPEGEIHIKVGRDFGLDEAVLCMRHCPNGGSGGAKRVVFDLRGTRTMQTAGLGFMLMVKERCKLDKEQVVIKYDHQYIGQLLYLAHFEDKFSLVWQEPEKAKPAAAGAENGGDAG